MCSEFVPGYICERPDLYAWVVRIGIVGFSLDGRFGTDCFDMVEYDVRPRQPKQEEKTTTPPTTAATTISTLQL